MGGFIVASAALISSEYIMVSKKSDYMNAAFINIVSCAKGCFGILGPSKSGKSSTLEILTGNGPMGYCPQNENLLNDFTVREVVNIIGNCGTEKVSGDKVDLLLDELGLYRERELFCRHLCSGVKRKVQVAMALIGFPSKISLDEPTRHMDLVYRERVFAVLGACKFKTRILFTSHDISDYEKVCDLVSVLSTKKTYNFNGSRYLIDVETVEPGVGEFCGGLEHSTTDWVVPGKLFLSSNSIYESIVEIQPIIKKGIGFKVYKAGLREMYDNLF